MKYVKYERALKWTKEKCIEGFDKNDVNLQKTREEKDKDWEFVVKMMCIIENLMNGNPNLFDAYQEERLGHNAIFYTLEIFLKGLKIIVIKNLE